MYFKLQAPTSLALQASVFQADLEGLDPLVLNESKRTFEIGTGHIEKVTRLRDRFQLQLIQESEYDLNELGAKYGNV